MSILSCTLVIINFSYWSIVHSSPAHSFIHLFIRLFCTICMILLFLFFIPVSSITVSLYSFFTSLFISCFSYFHSLFSFRSLIHAFHSHVIVIILLFYPSTCLLSSSSFCISCHSSLHLVVFYCISSFIRILSFQTYYFELGVNVTFL